MSRAITRGSRPGVEPEFVAFVRQKMSEGFDAVVVGHHHHPLHTRTAAEECLVIGDWIEHFTFADLSNGRLTLKHWVEDGEPTALPAADTYLVRPASRFFRPRA